MMKDDRRRTGGQRNDGKYNATNPPDGNDGKYDGRTETKDWWTTKDSMKGPRGPPDGKYETMEIQRKDVRANRDVFTWLHLIEYCIPDNQIGAGGDRRHI
jgi:hypothetical protein